MGICLSVSTKSNMSSSFSDAHIIRAGSSREAYKQSLTSEHSTENFLESVMKGEVMILVTLASKLQSAADIVSENGSNFLKIVAVSTSVIQNAPQETKVLSYRWDSGAVQFASNFDWKGTLAKLCEIGEYEIVIAECEELSLARRFCDSLISIFRRTGIKFLWVDQLCIPQNRSETMDIVHAAGKFYRMFEVLIWVPWVLKTDLELEADAAQLERNLDNDDDSLHLIIAQNISAVYAQCKRGWILREVSSECIIMESEKRRNRHYLFNAKKQLDKLLKRKQLNSPLSLDLESAKTLIKGANEAQHVIQVIEGMDGSPASLQLRVLHAARLTIAPFTEESDRSVVAGMDNLLETVNVAPSPTPDPDEDTRHRTLLRMLTYVGTGAFRDIGFRDWPSYPYGPEGCKAILDWFATTCKEFVSYSETLWVLIHTRLKSGHFTAYLPSDYPTADVLTAMPFSTGDLTCVLEVTGWGVTLKLATAEKIRETESIQDCDVVSGAAHGRLLHFFAAPRHSALVTGNFLLD